MNKSDQTGSLSSENKVLIVAVLFLILLIWGPVSSIELYMRVGYLIILPTLLYGILTYTGKSLKLNKLDNDRINRCIVAMISGGLFTTSIMTLASQKLEANAGTIILLGFAIIAGWYALARREADS